MKFGNETIISILKNIYAIVLFFLPLIFLIIYRRKIVKETNILKYICVLLIGIGLFCLDIKLQKNNENSIYYLYTSINDTSLNNEKLGVINSGILVPNPSIIPIIPSISASKNTVYESCFFVAPILESNPNSFFLFTFHTNHRIH